MQRNENREKIVGEDLSLKPIGIGFVLIIVVIIIFFSKNFLFKKEKSQKVIPEEISSEKPKDISVPMILPEDLRKVVAKDKSQLIDIREKAEFDFSHIENSKNIPLHSLKKETNSLEKNTPIIIIDRIETAEGKEITQYLNELGFSAKYLVGGIVNFSESGYSVISYGNPDSVIDIAKVNPISPEEMLNKVTNESNLLNIIDVRSQGKFKEHNLQGTINIPLEELEKRKKDIPAGKLIIIDEDPIRSFQGAVRLHDMNFIGVYCLKTNLSEFEKKIEELKKETQAEKKLAE